MLSSQAGNKEKIKSHDCMELFESMIKKTFLFSTIGRASCYLYNTHKDIIEVTDKDDTPKDFSYISSGDIADGEVLILSCMRLLDILSKDDIKDGFDLWNIEKSSDNIEHILLHEHTGKNIGFISFYKQIEFLEGQQWKDKAMHYILRACDNTIVKKALWYTFHLRDVALQKSKKTKQVLLSIWFLLSVFLLYSVLSGFFHLASNTQNVESAKENFVLAQDYIARASENMNDVDAFTHNMESAEELVKDLEAQNMFLSDLEKIKSNMSTLKKQFNGIEPFIVTGENTVYEFTIPQEITKVVSIANKVYVVHKTSISWPILQWEVAENFVFEELSSWDFFIDAAVYDSNIILVTDQGKVVNFAKNHRYSYKDVSDQATWEKSPIISTFSTNLYMLSDAGNQILRHKKQWNSFEAWVAYLSDEDALSVWKILSLAIDGGIYILKWDGSIVKLFRSPEYSLEWIVLNKLPWNYTFDNDFTHIPSLRARANLKYVYMLYENKILIFKPNTIRYQDVSSLNYVWQIEWKDMIIEDFYVDNDNEIFVASTGGVYKLSFDVIDEDLVLK